MGRSPPAPRGFRGTPPAPRVGQDTASGMHSTPFASRGSRTELRYRSRGSVPLAGSLAPRLPLTSRLEVGGQVLRGLRVSLCQSAGAPPRGKCEIIGLCPTLVPLSTESVATTRETNHLGARFPHRAHSTAASRQPRAGLSAGLRACSGAPPTDRGGDTTPIVPVLRRVAPSPPGSRPVAARRSPPRGRATRPGSTRSRPTRRCSWR